VPAADIRLLDQKPTERNPSPDDESRRKTARSPACLRGSVEVGRFRRAAPLLRFREGAVDAALGCRTGLDGALSGSPGGQGPRCAVPVRGAGFLDERQAPHDRARPALREGPVHATCCAAGFRSQGASRLPVERELGLCGGFSLGTVVGIVRLAAIMAFAQARHTFREFHEWAPSPRAALRMVDAVGAEAKPFLEHAPAPDDDGEVLVIEVDGRGAPMITPTERERRARAHEKRTGTRRAQRRTRRRAHPRPRRRQGDKSKNAKVAVVGVIYTLRKTRSGYEGPINKRLIGTFESHRALMRWLRQQADKRGYGRKRTLFLADGSEHIWREKDEFFPSAEGCLDWYHVVEKLWEVGRFLHADDSAALTRWVDARKKLLREGKIWQLIDGLAHLRRQVPNTGPGTKTKRQRLDNIILHFGEHADHMRYDRFREDGL